jgi:hypothetical protein
MCEHLYEFVGVRYRDDIDVQYGSPCRKYFDLYVCGSCEQTATVLLEAVPGIDGPVEHDAQLLPKIG